MSNYPPSAPPPSGGGYYGPPPKHPRAVMVLVFGILGLVCCQIFAPVAWIMGKNVQEEIQNSHGQYSGDTEANVGKILGIIGTVLLALYVVLVVVYLVIIIAIIGATPMWEG